MTPTEAITALEKALEAQPLTVPGVTFAEKADIRTLLDAHAGALRDAARLDWIVSRLSDRDFRELGLYYRCGDASIRDAIDAALATNAKGAAE